MDEKQQATFGFASWRLDERVLNNGFLIVLLYYIVLTNKNARHERKAGTRCVQFPITIMLKIEIKKKVVKFHGSETFRSYLIVNGIPDEDSIYLGPDNPIAHLYNKEVIKILTNYSFKEIGNTLSIMIFHLELEWWENTVEFVIFCNENREKTFPCIQLDLQTPDLEHWAKPWSMSSLAKEIEINVGSINNSKIKYWQYAPDSVLDGFGLEYYPDADTLTIKSELNFLVGVSQLLIEKTNTNLLTSIDTESLLTYFQFPEEIKTACKQYLIYFTQFIADLGIAVDTELKEELNYTLFKVVPKDRNESLNRISEALNVYLNVPTQKDFEMQIADQRDIAAKQWEANVYHLKSQLALATSIIQAKESTIELLQLTNYQYKQLLESHSSKKDLEQEDIIKGIVSLKKYEGKGFSIDFAEIFRRLKRLARK